MRLRCVFQALSSEVLFGKNQERPLGGGSAIVWSLGKSNTSIGGKGVPGRGTNTDKGLEKDTPSFVEEQLLVPNTSTSLGCMCFLVFPGPESEPPEVTLQGVCFQEELR